MVFKKTFGTPEEHVPTAYAPTPKTDIMPMPADVESKFTFSTSARGTKITLPLGEKTAIYGFGLQMNEINHRGNKISLRCNADPRGKAGDSHAL